MGFELGKLGQRVVGFGLGYASLVLAGAIQRTPSATATTRRRQSGIQARIQRLAHGNPGDYRNLKKGVSELRIDIGPGYRVYYKEREDNTIVIVLVGGDKSKQQRHIDLAYELAEQL